MRVKLFCCPLLKQNSYRVYRQLTCSLTQCYASNDDLTVCLSLFAYIGYMNISHSIAYSRNNLFRVDSVTLMHDAHKRYNIL